MTAPLAAIEVVDASLDYRLSRSSAGSLKEFMIHLFKRQVTSEKHRALDGVNLSVSAGEVVAVIGANGAGKSTLMKMIARVLPPTEGRVIVRGDLAPMIELGAGFNSELTGAENTLLYGTILGRSTASMRHRLPAIAKWSGLEEYMDVPIRSYSSGMLARLAFAIAVDVQPDVLLVDEVLSVGDAAFQRRSSERIAELIAGGAAVVLVSHDMDTVRSAATRVVWLDNGRVREAGPPESVVAAYLRESSVHS